MRPHTRLQLKPTGLHESRGCSLLRAVVDDSLKVHGLEGLRIADASIMPTMISGNLNAVVMAIGDKAADMILER